MVVLSEKVWCDPCIAPIVKALNGGGVPTVASCCGHGERDGSIVLADGRELVIRHFVSFDTPPSSMTNDSGEESGDA